MEIDLSQGELSLLTTLLEQRCEELRVEVRRTETPSYHDELREYERATLALLHKLERASSEPPSPVATRPTGS
ncbi:MAG TPA: hypothetical protein VJT73_08280, partial [Polyangiaceae bacterium]|nr:hypothetical protein [Polyangiaceae bacterium]